MKRYFIFFSAILVSCTAVKKEQTTTATPANCGSMIAGGKLFTAVWQQRAAEYKALCEQAYNIAALHVQQYYNADTSSKPSAIISDIDETFFCSSPYAVHQVYEGKDYERESWNNWVNRADADTLCGALAFFKYAADKGFTIFYVTNRDEVVKAATLQNLQKYGFPFADNEHLIMSQGSSSKESRRLAIEKNYNVALLLGDNLGDFSALFDHKTSAERTANVLNNKDEFGKRFIVLPNPNYGDWENAMYQYNYNLSPQQRDSVFKAEATGY
jgi:5'-nucleotidase (lipoprotein e(P4) family)